MFPKIKCQKWLAHQVSLRSSQSHPFLMLSSWTKWWLFLWIISSLFELWPRAKFKSFKALNLTFYPLPCSLKITLNPKIIAKNPTKFWFHPKLPSSFFPGCWGQDPVKYFIVLYLAGSSALLWSKPAFLNWGSSYEPQNDYFLIFPENGT